MFAVSAPQAMSGMACVLPGLSPNTKTLPCSFFKVPNKKRPRQETSTDVVIEQVNQLACNQSGAHIDRLTVKKVPNGSLLLHDALMRRLHATDISLCCKLHITHAATTYERFIAVQQLV